MNSTAERLNTRPLILQLLLEKGVLDSQSIDQVRRAQLQDSRPLEEILGRLSFATDQDIAQAYAEYFRMPLFEPSTDGAGVDPDLAQLLPEKLCRDHLIVPVAVRGHTISVAFTRPDEMLLVDEIQLATGMNVQPMIASISVVESMIGTLYYGSDWSAEEFRGSTASFEQVQEQDDELGENERGDEILHLDQPPPPGRDGQIIRVVNHILEQAFRAGASDIHLEPFEDGCKIRIRIDGVLNDITPPPQPLFIPIVSRLKVLAKMDIAEKRVPQDGAIALKSGDRRVDLRVSTMPTVHGEKVVIRVLDKSKISLQLTDLGLDQRQSDDLVQAIRMPHGLLLVTGPTGSGKSTTLYACLNLLNQPGTNICTVEDPVEFKFKGMNQVQVKTQIDLTFANALRSFLRQDPDVIMVGEVRDQETAEICMRAALTGHFVLSTLHTNDSLSAVTRLEDMGIEPFLLASTIRLLEAQRLIRRLCPECAEPYDCDPVTAKRFGLEVGRTLYRPGSCDQCRGTGYHGRVGIFEIIRMTSTMANLIQTKAPIRTLRKAAQEQGGKLLGDSALDKVRDGITSLEEAISVMVSDED